ncbi:MAG: hypothetical protein KA954_10015 [Chitinophagales bacterium]|nr:hypothetical protein [Chitinophagales bacterium]
MENKHQPIPTQYNTMFYVHLFVTILSWVGPFLVDWWLMWIAYGIVLMQFVFFNRCLMNAGHNIEEDKDFTFYAYLLEKLNIHFPRKPLKIFVRSYLYLFLGAYAYILQEVLMYQPPFLISQ